MTVDQIRELIQLVTETGIAELEVERGDTRVRIRRAGVAGQEIVATTAGVLAPAAAAAGAGAGAGPSSGDAAAPAGPFQTPREKPSDPNLVLVKSPIVGTFYESSAPDAPPFVSVGERIQPGKVLCIIESMKLMNEIEAEMAGIVESRLVMNGQPVEYGEALFAIRAV
ncbi:MAG: acetyl-CoA carboxylase biotin carboxyl carrier protein [Acidobacteriota bacterium]|nr:acetyl-CoA carboxylase biotin carboxyl carrier protein [Acidobacteriota bacterium]